MFSQKWQISCTLPLFAARKKFSFGFSHLRNSLSFFKNKSLVSFPIFPFSFSLSFPWFLACTSSCAYTRFGLFLCSFYHDVVFNVVIIIIFLRHFPAQLLHPLLIKTLASLFRRSFSALLWRRTNGVGRFVFLFVIGPREGCFYLEEGNGNCKSNGSPFC